MISEERNGSPEFEGVEVLKQLIKNLRKYKDLLYELVKKDIKLKYRNSVLGLLWTLLEPLLTMIVLTLVFQELLGRGDELYPVYVLSGRLLYSFFSSGTKAALKSVRSNGSMISKVYVPKYMYPVASILSNYLIFLLSLIVLVAVGAVMHVKPTLYMFEGLIPLFVIAILTLGAGLLLATLNVFFRDLEYLWTVALMLIMYTCAIFYKTDGIRNHRWIFKYNPLYSVIVNFRHAIFGEPLDMYHLWFSFGFSIVLLAVGIIVFWKKQDDFILYV